MFNKIINAPLSHKMIFLNLASLACIFTFVHFYVFPKIEDMFIGSYKEKIRNTVEIADNVITDIYARVEKGEISDSSGQKLAMSTIKSLRYNDTEYFWIHNLDLKMVAHPMQPKLEGTDVSDKKDPNGFTVFAEMNKVVAGSGSGFVHYMWPKPGSDHPVEKYSYVKLFKPWGWVTGSGIYFDQIRATVSQLRWAVYGGFGLAAILSCICTMLFAQRLSKTLKSALKALDNAGAEMSQLSTSLAETGHSVSEGVSESSASITETSASMDEISLMSQKNSDHSSQTHSSADKCLNATKQGIEVVGKVKTCMQEITKCNDDVFTQNQLSAKRINEIVQVIQAIADKTRIINDIVFQTKILSFNASVEAARAGDLGKGFSVVAEEVGNLAQMSGEAAKDIENSLTESIQKVESIIKEDISQTQQMISMASTKVQEGSAVVDKCGRIFEEILTQVEEVTDLSNQISNSCREQNIGFDEVKKAITQLEEASHNNAKASVEVATSVEKMVDQAQKVQSHSRTIFKMIDGDSPAA